jgi:BON domain
VSSIASFGPISGIKQKEEVPMKRIKFVLVLFLATATLAQQQLPPTSPPLSTPPTFPESQQTPQQPMPPDQEAPAQGLSTAEVQRQVQQGLNSEPGLDNSKVGVHVDENSVLLTGTVNTEAQHDLAMRIAKSYAGDRKIVDKIKIMQQT